MMRPKKLDDYTIKRIRELQAVGTPAKAIARRLDISPNTVYKHWQKLPKYKYVLTDSQGHTYKVDHIVDFCKERNLHAPTMWRIALGLRVQHRGWRAKRVEV